MYNPFRTRHRCDVEPLKAFVSAYSQACDAYNSRRFKRQMQILQRNARRQGVLYTS